MNILKLRCLGVIFLTGATVGCFSLSSRDSDSQIDSLERGPAHFANGRFSLNGTVSFKNDQLYLDGEKQPQLFGAELQYFRMRGGPERNVPRSQVLALWNKALDRMVEAKMNMVSFYIPWDFHEYKEGKFDFDGTVDEDGDGNPDFPSRDVKTFIRMIGEKGIKVIMVRPGPYINAEWGFLGFGAIPLWFHEKFPESHMRDSRGFKTRIYDYFNPDFRNATRAWFKSVYEQVMKPNMGPGKPIKFVQIDNETNFQWESIFVADYSDSAKARYRNFLESHYKTLESLNWNHGRAWKAWNEIQPPKQPQLNIKEDQDWFRFQDLSLFEYLKFVRKSWDDLGVKEPDVLFTLAESHNASPNGMIPNYYYRNHEQTGMATVNLYPKTFETPDKVYLNSPFKADHDVKAADASNDMYLGQEVQWTMGPEIQGGWFRGTEVTIPARQQTYLTTIGHGLKALMVYYFVEGQNWDYNWIKDNVKPFYNSLRSTSRYKDVADLPNEFFDELQKVFDKEVLAGFPIRDYKTNSLGHGKELHFDAPLDKNANPSQYYSVLKTIGEKIVKPYGEFLGGATELEDDICILRDEMTNVPTSVPGLESWVANGDWLPGLIGYLEHIGINPQVIQWDTQAKEKLRGCRAIFFQDTETYNPEIAPYLKTLVSEGRTLINMLGSKLSSEVGPPVPAITLKIEGYGWENLNIVADRVVTDQLILVPGRPFTVYKLDKTPQCEMVLSYQKSPAAYQCAMGKGKVIQIGSSVQAIFNISSYPNMMDVGARKKFLRQILPSAYKAHLNIPEDERVVAFARKGADNRLWLTVKGGNKKEVQFHVEIARLNPKVNYKVIDVLSDVESNFSGQELQTKGLPITLHPFGSKAFMISPQF